MIETGPLVLKDLNNDQGILRFNRELGRIVGGFSVGALKAEERVHLPKKDVMLIPYRSTAVTTQGVRYTLSPQDILVLPKPIDGIVGGDLLGLIGEGISNEVQYIKAGEIPKEPGIGGTRKMLKGYKTSGNADVHLIWVDDQNHKIPHFHKKIVELYFVLQGSGKIYFQPTKGEEKPMFRKESYISLKPNRLVAVPQNNIHQAVHDKGQEMIIQVIGLSKFFPQDVYGVNLLE